MSKLVQVQARLLGAAAFALGLLVLLTWALDKWSVLAFGESYVPMAPITALLVALLGGCQIIVTSRIARSTAGWIQIMTALLTSGVAILPALQPWHSYPAPWEEWFDAAGRYVGTIPLGRMAPLTGWAFLISAAAMAANAFHGPPARWVSMGASTAGLLIGAIVMAGYWTGTPFHYSSGVVPMAWSTALGFMLVNASVLLGGPLALVIRRWSHAIAAMPPGGADRAFTRRLAAVALLAGAVVIVGGLLLIRRQQTTARAHVRRELDAVANLKVAQLEQWRSERFDEGRFLQRAPAVAADISGFLEGGDPLAEQRVRGWLSAIEAGKRYESALLYDAQGRLRLVVSDSRITPFARAQLPALPPGNAIQMGDFELQPDAVTVHLDLVVPIAAPGRSDSQPAAEPGRLATVLLRLNPGYYLYPTIREWPLPSTSAEAVLVRRDGDQVLYLSELRHQSTPVLAYRRPIREPALPAALAFRGLNSLQTGEDYRGVPVMATARAVPGTPWILIAKIDLAEVYAPLRRAAFQSGLSVVLVLVVLGMIAAYVWRHRHAAQLKDSLVAEQQRLALAERLALVMRHANDSILVMDDGGRICEANERALRTYGYTLDELRQLPPGALRTPEETEIQQRQLELFNAPGGAVFETVHRRKDGSSFPVEVSGAAFELGGRRFMLGVYRDISQRRSQARQLERLNRLYAVLSQVNQAIVHARDRNSLLQEICSAIVKHGRFRMAWIGWLDSGTKEVRVLNECGDDTGYLDRIRCFADERPGGEAHGPTGTAIREGRVDVCHDVLAEPRMAHVRDQALQAGYRSSLAVPIRLGGEVSGALTVYATEPNFFASEEAALLEEAANDITFGLENLERDQRRREAEAALVVAEERYRNIFANAVEGIYQTTPEGTFLAANPALARILGYPSVDVLIQERKDIGRQGYVEPALRLEFKRRIESEGIVNGFESEVFRRDSSRIWVSENARVVRDNDGRVLYYEGSLEDITERKQAGIRILEQLEELRRWHDATLGREERILELKREVNDLLLRAGLAPRYSGSSPDSLNPGHE